MKYPELKIIIGNYEFSDRKFEIINPRDITITTELNRDISAIAIDELDLEIRGIGKFNKAIKKTIKCKLVFGEKMLFMGYIRNDSITKYPENDSVNFTIESELAKLKEKVFYQKDMGILKIVEAYQRIAKLNGYEVQFEDDSANIVKIGDLATRRELLEHNFNTYTSEPFTYGAEDPMYWKLEEQILYNLQLGIVACGIDADNKIYFKCILGVYNGIETDEYTQRQNLWYDDVTEWFYIDDTHSLKLVNGSVSDIDALEYTINNGCQSPSNIENIEFTDYPNTHFIKNEAEYLEVHIYEESWHLTDEFTPNATNERLIWHKKVVNYASIIKLKDPSGLIDCKVNRNLEENPDEVKFIESLKLLNQLYGAYLLVENGIIKVKKIKTGSNIIKREELLYGEYEINHTELRQNIDNKYYTGDSEDEFLDYYKKQYNKLISFASTRDLSISDEVKFMDNKGFINKKSYKIIGGGYKYECYCE